MFRKFVLAAFALAATSASAQTEIQFWHSMGGALGDKVGELATKFNATQNQYKVVATYKGSYGESMTAAIMVAVPTSKTWRMCGALPAR